MSSALRFRKNFQWMNEGLKATSFWLAEVLGSCLSSSCSLDDPGWVTSPLGMLLRPRSLLGEPFSLDCGFSDFVILSRADLWAGHSHPPLCFPFLYSHQLPNPFASSWRFVWNRASPGSPLWLRGWALWASNCREREWNLWPPRSFLISPEFPFRTAMCMYVCAQPLSRDQLFVTPWAIAHQAPQSMGFSRQEHWTRLPFPPPGDLP